ncbi:MAG: glycosyltransferase [Bacteroidetes bacterium]|nr:glycosyltransferase [Bacteroidota bacterium]
MKIVFLLSRFPYPLEKGDKLRANQHLINLSAEGHEVHLIALSDSNISIDEIDKVRPYCKSIKIFRLNYSNLLLNLLGSVSRKIPLQVGYFYSPDIHKSIEKLIVEINPDLVYCQLIRMASYIKNIKNKPLLIDYQDAFSRGTFQRMQNASLLFRYLFKREYNLVTDFERQSYNWFHGHIIISEQDRLALSIDKDKEMFVLPNGIDTNFFKPMPNEKNFDITFVGNMNYPPNIDAACFLVNEIMPLVWKRIPTAKVQLGGANPDKRVKKLASNRVTITGWMDDIRDCYKNTRVFIAPMRIGTGLQNKLLEAMAMKIPCITTPISFEPLNATMDVDILVGTDRDQLANHISTLLKDQELSDQIALDGYNFVLEKYSMQHSRKLLKDILESTVKDYRSRNHLGDLK